MRKITAMKLTVWILFFFILSVSAQDKFADIGTNQYKLNLASLEIPEPLSLPGVELIGNHDPKAAFVPIKRIETKDALYEALATLREQYEPFMKKLAPEVVVTRKQIPLETFNWRIETVEDQKDFKFTLSGKGSWEPVSIPHYGPPLGRATTYYHKEVELKEEDLLRGSLFICFKGVDYKAHVFFNDYYCGSHEGFFAPFKFNITDVARKGKNTLLVKVENDYPTTPVKDAKGNVVSGDKIYAATGPGYDDPVLGWHHCPAGMGIYQDCYLETRAPLHINDLFVRSLPDASKAEAWIEVNSLKACPESVKLRISVFGQNFRDTVISGLSYQPSTIVVPGVGDLAKPTDHQNKELKMGYGVNYLRVPVDMSEFRYWEPETPWLYELQVELYDSRDSLVDVQTSEFGMRSFTMDTVSVPKGRMFLNGKMIRLRGANTMGFEQQDVMRKDWDQLRDDILLAKLSNMNYLRFTQRPVQPEVYAMCDMLGIMNQIDLPLFGSIRRNKFAEAVKQAEEMERLVRAHPSTIMVTYINERFPNAEGYPHRALNTSAEYYQLFSALDQAVLLSNPDRVIKAGDGDYDPPSPGLPDSHCYNTWYNGHGLGLGEMYKGYWQPVKPGWLYACGEFGSEGLDPLNVMQQYYPETWLPKNKKEEKQWTANRISHAQTHRFHYIWYPTQSSLKNWIEASQDYQAWATKFVTETFRRDPRMVSFAIHLFIDAWPAGWMKSIMDVDRQPKKAYFAYRNALEPLMTSIRCDRRHFYAGETAPFEMWISNDLNHVPANCFLHYQIEREGKVVFSNKVKANIPENSSEFQGFFKYKTEDVKKRTRYLLRVALVDHDGKHIHQNEFDFEVFPTTALPRKKVFIAEGNGDKVEELLSQSGLVRVDNMNDADILLFDVAESYQMFENEVDEWVRQGKIALFIELPANEYKIGGHSLRIDKTSMGDYYFVSPLSGHKMMNQFEPFDFRFWVNESSGLIAPILSTTISGDKLTPVLLSGNTNWVASGESAMACAEIKAGKGAYRICQLKLVNRLKQNPTALAFFNQLISK